MSLRGVLDNVLEFCYIYELGLGYAHFLTIYLTYLTTLKHT